MNTTLSVTNFPLTIGVEHALVPHRYLPPWYGGYKMIELAKALNKELNKEGLKAKGFSKVKSECGALEISSPIIKNEDELKSFWNLSNDIFKRSPHKLVPNTIAEDTYVEGGGGHIHVGLQHLSKEQRENVYNKTLFYALRYPEITWFFSEYVDDDSLVSNFFKAVDTFCGQSLKSYSESLITLLAKNYNLEWGSGPIQIRNKQAYNSKKTKNTIEFRAFGAYKDYEQLKLCADFAIAFVQYVTNSCIWYHKEDYEKKVMKAYCKQVKETPDTAIANFNDLLVKLKLEPAKYKRFHKNFYTRLHHGNLHNFK